MAKNKETTEKKLPNTQTIKTDRGIFIIGRPLMKHRYEIADIINGLMKIEEVMGAQQIDALAEKLGVSADELVTRTQQDTLSPEMREELNKLEKEGVTPPFEDVAAIQLETVFVCLKQAPFEWDGTKESLEDQLDYGDGFTLFLKSAPYIMACVQSTQKQKK